MHLKKEQKRDKNVIYHALSEDKGLMPSTDVELRFSFQSRQIAISMTSHYIYESVNE
jgi:hypothetical protein